MIGKPHDTLSFDVELDKRFLSPQPFLGDYVTVAIPS